MYRKLLLNDLKRNVFKNSIIVMFMSISATLSILVCLILCQLFIGINTLYKTSKPPHFLQMHKGDINTEDLEEFNASFEGLQAWQLVKMVNVYGDELQVQKESGSVFGLGDNRIDISFVKQNPDYDILLSSSMEKLELNKGEIGVPRILLPSYDIEINDKIILKTGQGEKVFIVKDYVYDAQMNSSMVSSTRFLLNNEDFEELYANANETEYIIEAYFDKTSMASAYRNAYYSSKLNLPRDGQAVTYTMIFLISALSDMSMAMVYLIAGILLLVISLICLRFVILAEFEDSMSEIGNLKAIGIPDYKIEKIYSDKVLCLAFLSNALGLLGAFGLFPLTKAHMENTFGKQGLSVLSIFAAIGVSVITSLCILLFTKKSIGLIRKAGVVDLLVTGKGMLKEKKKRSYKSLKALNLNLLVAVREIRQSYGIIAILMFCISVFTLIPFRLAHTMEDKRFITYMGSSLNDIFIELEEGKGLEARRDKVLELIKEDKDISHVKESKRVAVKARKEGSNLTALYVDIGDEAGEGLNYLKGNMPLSDSDIVISAMMADELEKNIGDKLTLEYQNIKKEFNVSGIYQDITSGGKTAKSRYKFEGLEAKKYTFYIDLKEGVDKEAITQTYRQKLGTSYSTESTGTFIKQTFGTLTKQIKSAALYVFGVGILILMLIVSMFLNLRFKRNVTSLALKRLTGISLKSIYLQEIYPLLFAGGLGTLSGVLTVCFFGESFVSFLFRAMGIGLKKIKFLSYSFTDYAGVSFVYMLCLFVIGFVLSRQIRKIKPMNFIRE